MAYLVRQRARSSFYRQRSKGLELLTPRLLVGSHNPARLQSPQMAVKTLQSQVLPQLPIFSIVIMRANQAFIHSTNTY